MNCFVVCFCFTLLTHSFGHYQSLGYKSLLLKFHTIKRLYLVWKLCSIINFFLLFAQALVVKVLFALKMMMAYFTYSTGLERMFLHSLRMSVVTVHYCMHLSQTKKTTANSSVRL